MRTRAHGGGMLKHGVARIHTTTRKPHATGATPLGLAATVRSLPPSATLRMNELVAARRGAGNEIIHLGFGQASFPLSPQLRQAIADAASQTAYPPVLGLPALRAAIAEYLGRTRGLAVAADQIAVAPGSKPLIYALVQVLDGDVLLPVPSWVSYGPQVRLAGKRVIPVATDPDDHLGLTPEALGHAIARARHDGADPRILVVNSPSNPTGGMRAPEGVEALALTARAHGLALISDEIYAELAHGWREHVSPARFYPEGTIVTGGLSKAFSAGGWRLGYAAVPGGDAGRRLISAVRALASEIWSGTAVPIQAAAVAAYQPDPELDVYVRRSARLHGHIVARFQAGLAEASVVCARPAGAFYLYPDFARWREQLSERGITTSAELAHHLLDEWGIATLPASEFGEAPKALRLRLATSLLGEPDGLAGTAREEALWDLLARADGLGDGTASEDGARTPGGVLALPALDRAIGRFRDFVATLRD